MRTFQIYYWLLFFGIGALYPLLAIYLEGIGLTGAQIGIILSIGPIVTIFAQPLWGYISDRFQKPNITLLFLSLISAIIVIGFLFPITYFYFILIAMILAFFHSPLVPIADSVTLSFVKKHQDKYQFGAIRLWGAIGFAIAVWVTGILMELTFTGIIFYVFSISLIVTAWISYRLPNDAELNKGDLLGSLKSLFAIPSYVFLLISNFLIFGSINANNFYFGLYYTSIGGTIAGVGFVFLLAAGSEAPFMRVANYYISKFGIVNILIFSSVVGTARWLILLMEPSTYIVIAISILQGISVGLFIPASVMLVRELSPSHIKVTSMSFFYSVGNGLGTTFCTLFGGFIIDYYSITQLYLFFSITTVLGIGSLFMIKKQK